MHRLRSSFVAPCWSTLPLRPRYRAVALMLMTALAGVTLPAGAQTAPASAGGLPLQPATLAEGATPVDTAPSAANSPPAGNAAPADEVATMVSTLQKQIIAQQALLQVLQARLAAGSVPAPADAASPSASASSAVPVPAPADAASPSASASSAVPVPAGAGTHAAPVPTTSAGVSAAPVTALVKAGQGPAATTGQVSSAPSTSPTPAPSSSPAPALVPSSSAPAALVAGGEAGAPYPTTSDANRALSTEAQRQAYASGASVWREIQSSIVSQHALGIDLDPHYVMDGLQDMALNRPLKMSGDEMDRTMSTLNTDYIRRANEVRQHQEAEGKAYRIAFSKQKGTYSDAGAWYRIDDRGQGRHLRTTDRVVLQVTGTLPDGTVFDASGQQGRTRTVTVGSLLPSVAIGLQKVAPGGHLTVVVPPQKGYGDAGLPPSIPGGATLIFDITVKGLGHGE